MVEVTILGTSGEEFGYGACPTAMTFFEQAEMVKNLAGLRFPGSVAVFYRNLEDGKDPELAARVRQGELDLPLVLIQGDLRFEGGVPWQDIQQEIKAAI
jgi:disulfide oxidoreductase YuzD